MSATCKTCSPQATCAGAAWAAAKARDSSRVYWLTGTGNATAQALYDKLAERLGVFVYAHEL